MQKASSLHDRWRHVAFSLTAVLIVVADQLSKTWIRANLPDVGQTLFEIGFFQIVRVLPNTGAAFGLFQGQSFVLTIIAFVGIAILLLFAFFFHRHFPFLDRKLGKLALGLILGAKV